METCHLNPEWPGFIPYSLSLDDISRQSESVSLRFPDYGASLTQPYTIGWQSILEENALDPLIDDARSHQVLLTVPSKKRKRKAPTLRTDDFEPYKARILELHIEQNLPLPSVKVMIERESWFRAEYVVSNPHMYCID